MSATIAAIATPPGAGGLGVIRLSGDDAATIADRVFSSVSGKSLREMRGYTAAYGTVFNENGRIDDAVALVFTAPKSYTGENVVELSCHGGVYLLQKVLSALYAAGAVPAQPGEFTRRAFLNGKMTLTQVESIPETIHAQGEQALHAAAMLREGALFREIQTVNSALLRICAQLSAWIDYPDEEIEDVDRADFEKIIAESTEKLTRLKNGFEQGRVLREGVATAIVGKPNVGKSTLMNRLSGFERSIVTDLAGTTRDVVEETVRLGSVMLRLADTAGMRETSDAVEKIGVARAERQLEQADLVLAVFDASVPLDEEDRKIAALAKGKPVIAVLNKTDLPAVTTADDLRKWIPTVVELSAKHGENTDRLRDAVETMFAVKNLDAGALLIANQRQLSCVEQALSRLAEARECLQAGFTLDAVDVCVQNASQALLELTGEAVTDAVVDEVFKNFCVGK